MAMDGTNGNLYTLYINIHKYINLYTYIYTRVSKNF